MKPYLIIFNVFIVFNTQSAEMCSAKMSSLGILNPADNLLNTGLKLANIQFAQSDMKDFCQRNMLLRFINVKKNVPLDCEKKSTSDLEDIALETYNKNYKDDETQAWDMALIPTETSTRKAIDVTLLKDLDFENLKIKNPLDHFLNLLNSTPNSYTQEDKKIILQNIDYMVYSPENEKKVSDSVGVLKLTAFCAELNFLNSISCASATEKLIKKISIKSSSAKITNLDLWKEILTNDKYDVGIKNLAKKLISRIKDKINSKDNIFTDAVNSFVESGMSMEEAKISSIKLMGLIANGANNTAARLKLLTFGILQQGNKNLSLSLIATSLQYLDYKKSQAGDPLYSLPENVSSKCLSSKYHHFWMSAYLSWHLIHEMNTDSKVAAMAAFNIQKGYQVNRDIGRPDGELKKIGAVSTVLGKNAYDPVHQIIRTDLSFASSGALWGASNFNKKIDVDLAIVELLKKSQIKVPLTIEEQSSSDKLSLYNYWSNIFSPNSAFKNVEDQK